MNQESPEIIATRARIAALAKEAQEIEAKREQEREDVTQRCIEAEAVRLVEQYFRDKIAGQETPVLSIAENVDLYKVIWRMDDWLRPHELEAKWNSVSKRVVVTPIVKRDPDSYRDDWMGGK